MLPLMVEGSINAIIEELRERLNENLDLVAETYSGHQPPINLEHVSPDRYYISEAIDPLKCPAIFVIADRTDDDLTAQNWLREQHRVLLVVLVEDIRATLLQRKVWRYARAVWLTLHDQDLGSPERSTRVQIANRNYGPTIRTRGSERAFRKDVTLTLDVVQREAFV